MTYDDVLSLESARLRHVSFFTYCLYVAIPMAFVFTLIHLMNGEYVDSSVDFSAFVCFSLAFVFLEKVLINPVIARLIIALVFLHFLYHATYGSIDGSGLLWSYVFPFVTFYLLGSKEGKYWVMAFFAAILLSLLNPTAFGAYEYSNDFIMRFAGSYMVLIIFGYASVYFRERFFLQLHDTLKVRQRSEEELKTSLREKETLLSEIHHRVRNNLNLIQSLLSIESFRVSDKDSRDALIDSQHRISAMGLIHESLYTEDMSSSVNIDSYMNKLTKGVHCSFIREGGRIIHPVLEVEEMKLDVQQVIPLGLIANELLTNAYKYAFDGPENGQLSLRLYLQDQDVCLEVEDNGPGLPHDIDIQKTDSFGLKIVRELAKQIDGELTVSNGKGARFRVMFPLKYG